MIHIHIEDQLPKYFGLAVLQPSIAPLVETLEQVHKEMTSLRMQNEEMLQVIGSCQVWGHPVPDKSTLTPQQQRGWADAREACFQHLRDFCVRNRIGDWLPPGRLLPIPEKEHSGVVS